MQTANVTVLGGGIVGLATAYQFSQKYPGRKIRVLEKEREVAAHQTGHNSGVLHSGIYYKPGSLKAINCRLGKKAMERFCAEEGVPYEICGKVIVAVNEQEVPRLESIFARGQQNGVRCELNGVERLRELEPHAAGVRAIHVPEAGIVDYRSVGERMAERVRERGGEVVCGARVVAIRREANQIVIATTAGDFATDYAINCTGLHADRVARLARVPSSDKILPFRGEYYELKPEARYLCRNLIYPVPDPAFPFLGVHFTRMINGAVECGPNAVLAFAREGYRKRDINLRDLCEALSYRGFQRLAAKYWRMGLGEMHRSFSKAAFVRALQRLMPEIRGELLIPARAGVRAQAISPDGAMVDDFVIQETDRLIHVGNAPSPAATSSLNIGLLVLEKLEKQLL